MTREAVLTAGYSGVRTRVTTGTSMRASIEHVIYYLYDVLGTAVGLYPSSGHGYALCVWSRPSGCRAGSRSGTQTPEYQSVDAKTDKRHNKYLATFKSTAHIQLETVGSSVATLDPAF